MNTIKKWKQYFMPVKFDTKNTSHHNAIGAGWNC